MYCTLYSNYTICTVHSTLYSNYTLYTVHCTAIILYIFTVQVWGYRCTCTETATDTAKFKRSRLSSEKLLEQSQKGGDFYFFYFYSVNVLCDKYIVQQRINPEYQCPLSM